VANDLISGSGLRQWPAPGQWPVLGQWHAPGQP